MSNTFKTLDALCRIPPMTPREKVARAIQAHDNDHVPDGYANGLSDEVSDWSAYLADRVLTALSSGSGDHAELALNAKAAQTWALGIYENKEQAERRSKFIDSDLPATVLALLAEIAALRAEHVHLVEQKEGAEDALFNALSRATEAERKLAEAVGLLTRWLNTRGEMSGAGTVETATSTFLSKEAERG